MRHGAVAALALATLGPGGSAWAEASWDFVATLDGTPIGSHRFTVTGQGETLDVRSVANFNVTVFGFSAYRYAHEATEAWRGGCLVSMQARTDDDGKLSSVDARMHGGELAVRSASGASALPGCVMSFAYWNPAMQKQSYLLNAQTGRYEAVHVGEIESLDHHLSVWLGPRRDG